MPAKDAIPTVLAKELTGDKKNTFAVFPTYLYS